MLEDRVIWSAGKNTIKHALSYTKHNSDSENASRPEQNTINRVLFNLLRDRTTEHNNSDMENSPRSKRNTHFHQGL